MDSKALRKILTYLEKEGLLLEFDTKLPSAVSFISNESIKGSWWGHPMGNTIFKILNEMEDHDDLLKIKLIANKNTYVHRKLWPALVSVAMARESWQIESLSADSIQLLKEIRKKGVVRMDRIFGSKGSQVLPSHKKAAAE